MRNQLEDLRIENTDIREMTSKYIHQTSSNENEINNLKTINENLRIQIKELEGISAQRKSN